MGHPLLDVVAALVDLVALPADDNGVRMGALPALADVQVFDGPTPDEVDAVVALGVGVAVGDVTAADGTETPSWGGREDVSFDVGCVAEAWSGEVDRAGPRAAVVGVLEAVRSALVENEDLGGVCTRAYLAGWRYSPVPTDRGSMALMEFTVRVDATRFEGE